MPTLKQEALAKELFMAELDPENATSQVQMVERTYGYEKSVATKNASSIVGLHGTQTALERLREKFHNTITPQKLVNTFNRSLHAKTYITNRDGEVVNKVPNHSVQLEAAKIGMKIGGLLNESSSVDARQMTFNIAPDSASKLSDALKKLDVIAERFEARKKVLAEKKSAGNRK